MAGIEVIKSLLIKLNTTGLNRKDQQLYDFLRNLVVGIESIDKALSAIDTTGSVITNNLVQQFIQYFDDISDNQIIPGPQGIQGIRGIDGLFIKGEDGIDGLDGFNIKGDKGDKGDTGQIIYLEPNIAESDLIAIPGPTGATGATGAAGSSGKVAQIVTAETTTVATGTTTIPVDNTIPQNTEGTQFLTAAITPTNANSTLVINVSFQLASHTATRYLTIALFQDTTANALSASTFWQQVVDGANVVTLIHTMIAGTTSSTTFKVRAGTDQAGTITLNGANGSQFFGGVMSSTITITEVTP